MKLFLEDALNKSLGISPIGNTHMPFVFYDKDGNRCLLFDVKNGIQWKLYCFQNGKIFKVNTPSANKMSSECNGMVYYEDGLYHLTYTFNDFTNNRKYLTHATGKTLKDFAWQDPLPIEIGMVNSDYVCAGYISNRTQQAHGGDITFYRKTSANITENLCEENKLFKVISDYHFAKMGFIHGEPDKIMLTYVPHHDGFNLEGTVIIDVKNKTIKDIVIKSRSAAYKASIDPKTKECYYAERLSGFEQRTVVVVPDTEYTLEDTSLVKIV